MDRFLDKRSTFGFNLLARIIYIIHKDLLSDAREQFSFLSAILYLVTITWVVFKVFGDLTGPTRIGIYWILLTFTAVNIVTGSFGSISSRRKLTHYQFYDPFEVLSAKLILNFAKVLFAGLFLLLLLKVFTEHQLQDPVLFGKTLVLTATGIVAALTLVSSMTVYASNQNALLTILAIPLLLPVLLIGMKVSLVSERMFFDSAVNSNLLMLFGLDIVMIVLGLILITITWKA